MSEHAMENLQPAPINSTVCSNEHPNGSTTLRKSEALFRSLYESSGEAIMVRRPDRTLLMANPAAIALFGCKDEAEMASLVPDKISPEFQPDGSRSPEKSQQLTDAALRGKKQSAEWIYRLLDGRLIYAIVMLNRVDIDDETFLQVIIHDITSQKEAEYKIREGERRYRLLAENLNDLIWTMDLDGKLTYFSPSAQRLLGYSWSSYKDFRIECLLTPDSLGLARSTLNEILATAKKDRHIGTRIAELEQIRKDGSTVWTEVSVSGMYDESGGIVGIQGVTRDITERRRLEAAIRDNQQKLRAILDHTYEFIGVLSLDGILTDANKAALVFSGIDESEVIGKPFWDTPWWSHSHALQQELREWIAEAASGVFIQKEVTHLNAQGSLHWVDFSLKPVKNDNGKVIFIIPEGRDITKRMQMENEIRKAKEAAEAATQAKSNFLAKMSHEIRTPMTAILGYADLSMDPSEKDGDRINYATVIHRNAEHLLTLINDILDLSKIEANKLAIEKQRCSVIAILSEVACLMLPTAKHQGISFTVEYQGEIPETIFTDGYRLRQAIINLVGNAVKFTKQGCVRIAVSLLAHWHNDQPALRIEVIDTGIGISNEQLAKLFRPFSQANTSISEKYGGTGLGLAISYQIVQMLGGDLNATSILGKGSTFTLIVPTGSLDGVVMLKREGETVLDVPQHIATTPVAILNGVRVLLAEDGIDNREFIETILRKVGADVTSVESGGIAVQKAKTESFDVVLMDINMPEMDGYEATRLLRHDGYDRPILALTADAMAGDIQKCLAMGFNEHLAKPIDRTKLIHIVAKYANRQLSEP